MRYGLLLVAAFAFSVAGCEKPAPPTTPPPPVVTPPAAEREIHIDAGRPGGVEVDVDVDPAPGGPDIKVDVDRPAQP